VFAHGEWVFYHHGMARPQVAVGGDGFYICRVALNMCNMQEGTADKRQSPGCYLGWAPTIHCSHVTKCYIEA
jgi:hypothetical protein